MIGKRGRWIVGAMLMIGLLMSARVLDVPRMRHTVRRAIGKSYTVEDRFSQFGESVAARLRPKFESAGIAYPPRQAAFLVFKEAKRLDLYGQDAESNWKWIATYPVLAASGVSGPKLKEGDQQVPEGIYRIESLNPNSLYHVSLRLNYPNEFDRRMAALDRRTKLGGDIMIHGRSASVGCLAMGDQAAEELFTLAALTGLERIKIVIAPTDFRIAPFQPERQQPRWIESLYGDLRRELVLFPSPE